MKPDLTACTAWFARDPVRYLDLTEAIRRGEGRVLSACSTGALISFSNYEQEGEARGFGISAADWDTARRLTALLPDRVDYLVGHETFYETLLQDRTGLSAARHCVQAAYRKKPHLPLPDLGLDIRPLRPEHLPVFLRYYALGDEGYFFWLMEHNALFGAFDGDALTGFVGRHAEGAMGLLEVLPAWRRRGIGTLLQSYMTNVELSAGHIPYGQIFTDNTNSLALQKKLGFCLSEGELYWAVPT